MKLLKITIDKRRKRRNESPLNANLKNFKKAEAFRSDYSALERKYYTILIHDATVANDTKI